MAINKLYPRVLSKSKDTRIRKGTEMLDALNLRASESLDAYLGEGSKEAEGGMEESGNAGVLKPILGTVVSKISGEFSFRGATTILGSVSDEARGHVYFFIWSDDPSEHCVARYEDASQTVTIIYQTEYFAFRYGSVVQGAVAHVATSLNLESRADEKTLLYFTDNQNEPRCLDITACLEGEGLDYRPEEVVEFISLCPVTPVYPIQTEWATDYSRPSSEFRNSKGMQFAYQNVYKNGSVSAFSVYSKLAVNPAYLSQGSSDTAQVDAYNLLSIRIPLQRRNVESIKLYGREGNDGAWFFIDELKESDVLPGSDWSGPFTGYYSEGANGEEFGEFQYNSYRFYNDITVSYVPEDITFKQYDSVPQMAEAIAISNDRTFLGNYVEGYDNNPVDANLTYVPIERPEDFSELELTLKPEVRVIKGQAGVKNRITGFRLDMSGAPEEIAEDTTFNVSITLNPDQNIHLYQSNNSFHASTNVTHEDPDAFDLLKDRVSAIDDDQNADLQTSLEFLPQAQAAGKISPLITSFGGEQFDVRDLGWDPIAAHEGTFQNSPSAIWTYATGADPAITFPGLGGGVNDEEEDFTVGASGENKIQVAYGTSPSNPLILQGKSISFFARIRTNTSISKSQLSTYLGHILSGKTIVPPVLGVTPAPGQFATDEIEVLQSQAESSYSIDCGLSSRDYISLGQDNHARVCYVMDRGLAELDPRGVPPCGYFIVNKADVTWGLTRITSPQAGFDNSRKYGPNTYEDYLGNPQTQGADEFFGLSLLEIRAVNLLTCLPDISGGYMPSGSVGVATLINERPHMMNTYEAQYDTAFSVNLIRDNIESANHIVKGWTVLGRGDVAAVIANSNLVGPRISGITSPATKKDLQRIANGNYLGGQFMQYQDQFFFYYSNGAADSEIPLINELFDPPVQSSPGVNESFNYSFDEFYETFPITGMEVVEFFYYDDIDLINAFYAGGPGSTYDFDQGVGQQTFIDATNFSTGDLVPYAQTASIFVMRSSPVVINQISKMIGYLDVPGKAVNINDGDGIAGTTYAFDGDLDRPYIQGGGGAGGSLVPTFNRLFNEYNSQLNTQSIPYHRTVQGQNAIITNVCGYTIIDGESGPGSNKSVGSVNSTTIRDGILYYHYGAGYNENYQLAKYGETQIFNPGQETQYGVYSAGPLSLLADSYTYDNYGPEPITTLGSPTTGDTNANGVFLGIGASHLAPENPTLSQLSAGVRTGFFCNPFEYYMAYAEDAYIPIDYFEASDISGVSGAINTDAIGGSTGLVQSQQYETVQLNQDISIYDGSLTKHVFDFGQGTNIDFAGFGAGEYLLGAPNGYSNLYVLTEPQAWWRQFIPHIEIVSQSSYIINAGLSADRRSFKTNASHSFGVVYSDFFGRQGGVQPLGSCFVPPYELQEASTSGAVEVAIEINTPPPSWAFSYQIVYGGNTSQNRFIQYSAGGGFLPDAFNQDVDIDLLAVGIQGGGNIYVSLNYLQGNSDVSYAEAFGARTPDGSNVFYEYRPGDRLKVISYVEGGNRIYANNIEFEVVGTAILGDNEDNPLHSSSNNTSVPKHLQGSFVIIRNNPLANGFNVQSIANGVVDGTANGLVNTASLWNNRCIIELYSPASITDIDDRPYREIGESYKVFRIGDGQGGYYTEHQLNPIRIREGDVYFRRHAVNFPSNVNGEFPNIVTNADASVPLFYSYYLESETFNDKVIGSNQYNYGRIKTVIPNAKNVRRYSSIIFSDQDDYTDTTLRLNSFDATKQPYKDLPNTYGNLTFLVDQGDSLFALQQTKACAIPVNRSIISDVSGSESIISTARTLGTHRYYAGENGCDTNPESVAINGNTIFWANKRKGEVYRFDKSTGVKKISDLGMSSYFRDMFLDLDDLAGNVPNPRIRVSGGYDPEHDEYVLSAYVLQLFDLDFPVLLVQPLVSGADLESDEFVDLNVVTDGLSAEDEAALIANNTELQGLIAQQQEQINQLFLDLATQTQLLAEAAANASTGGSDLDGGVQEIIEEIQQLREDLQLIDIAVNDSLSVQQVSHTSIRQQALVLLETARTTLRDLFNQEAFLGSIGGVNVPGFNPDTVVNVYFTDLPAEEAGPGFLDITDPTERWEYGGFVNPLPNIFLRSAIQADIKAIWNLVVGYLNETALYNLYSVQEAIEGLEEGFTPDDVLAATTIEYTVGYGAGSPAPEGSAVADGISYLEPVLINGIIFTGTYEVEKTTFDDFLTNQFADLTSRITGVAGSIVEFLLSQEAENREFLDQVLQQIHEMAKGIYQARMADFENTENLDDIETFNPASIPYGAEGQDIPVLQFGSTSELPSIGVVYNPGRSARDLFKEIGGQILTTGQVETKLREAFAAEGGVIDKGGFKLMTEWGIMNGVTTAAVDRFGNFDQELAQFVATRNAFAYIISEFVSNLAGATGGKSTEELIAAGIDSGLANILSGGFASAQAAYLTLLDYLDTSGPDGEGGPDGQISLAEAEVGFPGGSLFTAFQELFANPTGSTGSGSGAWEGVQGKFASLLREVLDLSEAVGLIDENDTDDLNVTQGFDLTGIGLIDSLRERFEDSRWADGNIGFINGTIDAISQRVDNNDGNNKADIIGMFSIIKDNLEQLALIGQGTGYASSYGVNQSAEYNSIIQSPVYKTIWFETITQAKDDLNMALSMLGDFQRLFSASSKEDLNVEFDAQVNPDGVTLTENILGDPANTPEGTTARGLRGVSAEDLIFGRTLEFTPLTDPENTVATQSAYYGFASVISRVNEALKNLFFQDSLGETVNAGLLIDELGESFFSENSQYNWSEFSPLNRNLRAILPSDVSIDLNSSYTANTYSAQAVANLVNNLLNPNSEEYYSPEFADLVFTRLLQPLEGVVNAAGPAALGDLNLDGVASNLDFLLFLERWGDAIDRPGQVPINMFTLPSDALAALNQLTTNEGIVAAFTQQDFLPDTFNIPPIPFGSAG